MLNPIKMVKDFIEWRTIISTSENYVNYLRQQGIRIGENTEIYGRKDAIIDTTRPWLIEIGNNVEITANIVILTHGYDWCVFHHKDGEVLGSVGKVKINDNVFIGLGCTILPGTEIGENTIIGAASVVKGNLIPNSVYAGVPAKRICSLEEYYEKRKKLQVEEAVLLVNEYFSVYKKEPEKRHLHEHFWLFENDINNLEQDFIDKLALRGNFEKSKIAFENNIPKFKDFNEFLKYCQERR